MRSRTPHQLPARIACHAAVHTQQEHARATHNYRTEADDASKHRNQHLEGTSSCRCDQSALIRTEANCGPRAALGCSRVRALPPPMHARLRVLCAQPMMKCFLPPCLNQIMRDIEHSHFSMTEAPFARVVRAFARLSFATTAEMRFPFVWLLN